MERLTTILELIGFACVATGVGLLFGVAWFLIVAGVELVAVSALVGRRR